MSVTLYNSLEKQILEEELEEDSSTEEEDQEDDLMLEETDLTPVEDSELPQIMAAVNLHFCLEFVLMIFHLSNVRQKTFGLIISLLKDRYLLVKYSGMFSQELLHIFLEIIIFWRFISKILNQV